MYKKAILISLFIILATLATRDIGRPVKVIEPVQAPVVVNVESYPAPIDVPTLAPYPGPEPVVTPCPPPVCTIFDDKNGNRYGTCYQTCFEP